MIYTNRTPIDNNHYLTKTIKNIDDLPDTANFYLKFIITYIFTIFTIKITIDHS